MSYTIDSKLHRAFIDAIRERRQTLDLTQKDVARAMRVDQSTYAGIESGRASPSLDTIERVAKALKFKNAIELLASKLSSAGRATEKASQP
jgi:transcriptional regulator with XRE-family HTH domain